MPRTVRVGHKDLLHDAVGRLFVDQGFSALDLSGLSGGCPDWLIARGLLGFLVEVKTEANRRPSKGHDERGLNPRQQDFLELWRGKFYIITSLEEAWRIVDEHRARDVAP